MLLSRVSSPHMHGSNSTQKVMLQVCLACLPALAVMTGFYGFGTLINLVWIVFWALSCEAVMLRLRHRPIALFLQDGSALVTAMLLALALPPWVPWWLSMIAVLFGMILGKHLYGGLGQNPFNPAMVGYVVVLISFPLEMTQWPAPGLSLGLLDSFQLIFGSAQPDAWAQATALDTMKMNKTLTVEELWTQSPAFGWIGGRGSEWVNLAFLLGGLYLLWRKVISWHAPVCMLAALLLMSLVFWNGSGSDSHGSPLFHLFSGATMLGAFFIITDPTSGATSNRGRCVFGIGVGIIVYLIRAWGGYPDGMAFAVLLMNLSAPTIDYYTRPRTYGHSKAESGMKWRE